jgi:AcrR family transcriptional regulator
MATRTETYERILQAACEQFERFGAMKTTVADIARALRMSPANIYKFFPTKRAIIEAVGERRMAELRRRVQAATASRKPAWERIQDLIRLVSGYFYDLILRKGDRLELDLMRDVIEFEVERHQRRWLFITAFHDFLRAEIARLLRAGIAAGEFHMENPEEAAAALLECFVRGTGSLILLELSREEYAALLERQFRLLDPLFR